MRHETHKVFAKIRKADGSETIVCNNVRGKAAETRWVRALEINNKGMKVLDHWTLSDGRGLNEFGVQSCRHPSSI